MAKVEENVRTTTHRKTNWNALARVAAETCFELMSPPCGADGYASSENMLYSVQLTIYIFFTQRLPADNLLATFTILKIGSDAEKSWMKDCAARFEPSKSTPGFIVTVGEYVEDVQSNQACKTN